MKGHYMLNKAKTAKKYVEDHKVKILTYALTVTTTAAVLLRVGLTQHDNFLKEHNLFDTFYHMED